MRTNLSDFDLLFASGVCFACFGLVLWYGYF